MSTRPQSFRPKCATQTQVIRRGSASQRGYDARWRRVRLLFMQEHPICKRCRKKGFLVVAEVVDHIVPMARGGAQYDDDNLQSLCKKCHDRKTATEDGGFGYRRKE